MMVPLELSASPEERLMDKGSPSFLHSPSRLSQGCLREPSAAWHTGRPRFCLTPLASQSPGAAGHSGAGVLTSPMTAWRSPFCQSGEDSSEDGWHTTGKPRGRARLSCSC